MEHKSKPTYARRFVAFGVCAVVILVIALVMTRERAPFSAAPESAPSPATASAPSPRHDPITRAIGVDSAPPSPVPVRATAPADSPTDERRFLFQCGSIEFAVRTIPGEATLFAPQLNGNEPIVLPQTPVDAGLRYSNGETVVWIKGSVATLQLVDRAYGDCVENRFKGLLAHAQAIGDIVWATGNEPSWTLDIHPQKLTLTMEPGAQHAEFPYRDRVEAGDATTYRSSVGTQEIVVVVESRACNDSKSGEAFLATVAVTFEQRTYYGCGALFPLNMPRPQ